MTQEQGPQERKRYFTDLDRQMLSWMVFEYNERMKTPDAAMAKSLGIDIDRVKSALRRLKERCKCDRIKAITIMVEVAAVNEEIDTSRILVEPNVPLSRKEEQLKQEYSAGNINSQIMANIGENLDRLNQIRAKLFKKFNATNRFAIAVSDALSKFRNRA